jgi:hypothetical protein
MVFPGPIFRNSLRTATQPRLNMEAAIAIDELTLRLREAREVA